MRRLRAGARLLLGVGFSSAGLAGGCTQNPSADTRCVYETGDVASGACYTECESQCALEKGAGCVSGTCEADCERSEAGRSAPCEDARYELWRCLRVQGLPEVTCSAGQATLSSPDTACPDERAAARTACSSVDSGAGSGADAGTGAP